MYLDDHHIHLLDLETGETGLFPGFEETRGVYDIAVGSNGETLSYARMANASSRVIG